MICKNCGKELDEGYAYCDACGARVIDSAEGSARQNASFGAKQTQEQSGAGGAQGAQARYEERGYQNRGQSFSGGQPYFDRNQSQPNANQWQNQSQPNANQWQGQGQPNANQWQNQSQPNANQWQGQGQPNANRGQYSDYGQYGNPQQGQRNGYRSFGAPRYAQNGGVQEIPHAIDILDSNTGLTNPIMKMGREKSFLIAVILFAASTLLTLIVSFFTSSTAQIMHMLVEQGLIDSSFAYNEQMLRLIKACSIIASAPSVLFTLSLVLFHVACVRCNLKTKSLLIIKIVYIVILALAGLALTILLVAILASDVITAFFVLFILGIAFILPFMYILKIIRTIDNINSTLARGIPTKISSFIVAINWIIIVLNGLSAIMSLASLSLYSFFGILSTGLTVAFLIMINTGISTYNDNYCYRQY